MTATTEYFVTNVGWEYPVGIPVNQTSEVISLLPEQVCSLPTTHPAVLGVVGWRGQLVWTIALDTWLGVGQTPDRPSGQISRPVVVLQERRQERRIACVVHRLEGIEVIASTGLGAVPIHLPPALKPYFAGQVPDSQLLVLNDQCLFQPETWRIIHHDHAI